MIYKIYDPYDLKNLYKDETVADVTVTKKCQESKECFICLHEKHEDDDELTDKLSRSVYYINLCDCNGWVHTKCLNHWYRFNNTCPICRYRFKLSYKKKIQFIKLLKLSFIVFIVHMYIRCFIIKF